VWSHGKIFKTHQVSSRRSTERLNLGVDAFTLGPGAEHLDRGCI
jgi:hypothetical protein